MTAFDEAWDLVKSQKPEFNPRDDPEDNGNYPYNAEEAYEAAMRGEPVYHCPSCDAYLDKHVCMGHAYPSEIEHPDGYSYMGSAFKQPEDAAYNPKGHAFMQNGMVGGHENTTPTWKMSARERYGIGYHPVPDPADISEDEGIMGFLGNTLGNLKNYREKDDSDKRSFNEFMQDLSSNSSYEERFQHLRTLMAQSGLSAEELEGMLTQQDFSQAPDVKREQAEMRETFKPSKYNDPWMGKIWEHLKNHE